MKKNNAGSEEVIEVRLSEEKFPIAYKSKLEELINQGFEETDARKWISTTSFVMELYYSKDQGLFLIESEAVESTTIFNPYSGEELEECEDTEIEQDESKIYCCPKCGSTDIQIKAWTEMNTNKYIGDANEESVWCPNCERHFEVTTVEAFKTDGPTDDEGI